MPKSKNQPELPKPTNAVDEKLLDFMDAVTLLADQYEIHSYVFAATRFDADQSRMCRKGSWPIVYSQIKQLQLWMESDQLLRWVEENFERRKTEANEDE